MRFRLANCLFFLGLLLLLSSREKVSAFEAYPLFYESVRTKGMGGASVALSDDEQALYSNPAALAFRTKKDYSFVNSGAELNQDYRNIKNETDRLSDLDTPQGRAFNNQVLSKIMGNRARGQAHNLAYYLGSTGFGAGILAQGVAEIEVMRPTNPLIKNLQMTEVVLSGSFAKPVPGVRSVFRDKAQGWWGASAKVVNRSYLSKEFDPRDFAGLSENDLKDSRFSGMTLDADFGTFWALDNKYWQTLGLTVGNIFENEIDPRVGKLRRLISVGTAIKPLSGPVERKKKLVLAADLWDVSEAGSFWKMLRLGMEVLPRPWLTLRGGVRGGYLSGGLTAAFDNVSFHAAVFSEERGPRVGDFEDRRYTLGLNIHF